MSFLKEYLFGWYTEDPADPDEAKMPDAGSLCETGADLVDKVASLIALRRPVLLTGSRGCGKTYCAEQGAQKAISEGIIGGKRFLQGNRELPREYLSEDGLAIDGDKPATIPALAMTPIKTDDGENNIYKFKKPDSYVAWLESQGKNPARIPWPAIPADLVDPFLESSKKDPAADPRVRFWKQQDWWVLFLDEVNRFGDGFLDGLLSLAEEGKIVRGGQAYYVPVVLVCTANPPGYDITAKRLSPPLQSRIAASYRVGQPGLNTLNGIILEDRLRQIKAKNHHLADIVFSDAQMNGQALKVTIPDEIRILACTYLLSLWGNPGVSVQSQSRVTKGVHYLLPKTRWELHELIGVAGSFTQEKRTLMHMLNELGDLAEYGPDARAIGDWFSLVLQNIIEKQKRNPQNAIIQLDAYHLRSECVPVLGKKIREIYNEASDPDKDNTKEKLLLEIFDAIFFGSANQAIRELVFQDKVELISYCSSGADKTKMIEHIEFADPRWRARYIKAANGLIKSLKRGPIEWSAWRKECSKMTAFSGILKDECFRTLPARSWISQALMLANQKILAKDIMLAPCVNTTLNLQLYADAAKTAGVAKSIEDGQMAQLIVMVQKLYRSSRSPSWQKCPERALSLAFGLSDALDRIVSQSNGPELTKDQDDQLNECIYWYLGWFLEETVGAIPEQNLVSPWASPRPLKSVLREAVSLGEALVNLKEKQLDLDNRKVFVRANELLLKRAGEIKANLSSAAAIPLEQQQSRGNVNSFEARLKRAGQKPNPSSVTAAPQGQQQSRDKVNSFDIVLIGKWGQGFVSDEANRRKHKFPFNLAGYTG